MTSTLDNLPKPFVNAMRTLFDIMDDKQTGFVNFADIEARWQDDESKGLPKGVLESLRKVTPPNGMLSFERFCAGLKICLLRNQMESIRPASPETVQDMGKVSHNRPPSVPLLDIPDTSNKPTWVNTAAVRPHIINQQKVSRTYSMPQLKDQQNDNPGFDTKPPLTGPKGPLYGPPKPPRSAVGVHPPGNMDKAEIRNALVNWQMGLLINQEQGCKENKAVSTNPVPQQGYNGFIRSGRSLGDGKASSAQPDQSLNPTVPGAYQRKPAARRREPRRHTLQNGIDYNMLKRMKQIEQEKEVLMNGLGAVERARDWYLKQIANVQDKMKYLGRMGHVETWSEAQQERLELQKARVLEVNRHLATLTDSWERGGLPLHMNLAVHHLPPHSSDSSENLKQQNRILTEELTKKNDRITALEREKASLMQVLQIQTHPIRSTENEEAVF